MLDACAIVAITFASVFGCCSLSFGLIGCSCYSMGCITGKDEYCQVGEECFGLSSQAADVGGNVIGVVTIT